MKTVLIWGLTLFMTACGAGSGLEKISVDDQVVEAEQDSLKESETNIPEPPTIEDQTNTEEKPEVPELPNEYRPIVDAASQGPELVGVQLYGEQWNVKKALVTKNGNVTSIEGRISHHIAFAPDDQIDYRFEFVDGVLQTNEINTQIGGWSTIAGPILDIVSDFTAVPIPVNLITSIISEIENLVKGDDWRMNSQKMAMIISLQIYAENNQEDSTID